MLAGVGGGDCVLRMQIHRRRDIHAVEIGIANKILPSSVLPNHYGGRGGIRTRSTVRRFVTPFAVKC